MKQKILLLFSLPLLGGTLFAQTWTTYNTSNSGLAGDAVTAMVLDAQGNKWFGTDGNGISMFDGINWTTYTTANSGLTYDHIRSIAIDGQNWWFGHDSGNGLSMFNGTNWMTYNTSNSGLPTDDVISIAIDAQGYKWITTFGGGVAKFDGITWIIYNTSNGLANDNLWYVFIDTQGNKWFGTDGGGVSKFDGTNWTTYSSSNSGLANDVVVSISQDLQGNIWFGTRYGGVSKFDGTNWTTYNTSNSGLANLWVHAIEIDAQGNKWFGGLSNVSLYTADGVSTFNGINWTTYNTANSGLSADPIYSIQTDTQGDIWFATYGGGVSKLSNPQSLICTAWINPPISTAYTATNYLCSNSIINNTQNGTYNNTTAIQRNELAKITYLGLYGTNNPTIPSDSFPTPFNDMQSASAANSYWYKAAKSLCYLEFGDGISPFSRDFFNFNPANPIKRKYALKVFMEAFNITPDPTGASPFGDVLTTDAMFGYINKAYQLGLVTGSNFYPNDNLTREDAFIILYRILTNVNITKPTLTTLQDSTNYFIPGNYILANLSKTPSIAQGNFSQYEKSSFALAGRGLPLEFTHSYNSFMTELPATFFEAEDGTLNNQRFNPLGTGWTHNYNNYIQKVVGYTAVINGVSVTVPTKWYIFWGDGTIHIYNPATSQYETKGVYDNLTVVSGNEVQIKTKGQITYRFLSTYSADLFFPDYIQDRNGNKLQYYYQQPGGANTPIRISKITDVSTGRYLTFAYQTVGGKEYLQSVTESGLSRNITFTIDANGNLETFKDAKNQTTTYLYTATGAHTSHLLTKIQLPKGNIIENEYFQRKLIATRSLDQNNTVTSASTVNWGNDYTTSQGKSHSTITDAQNRQTTYQHNTLGNPESITSPTTAVSNIVYGTGNDVYLPQSMSINSQSLGMSYDNKGNLLNITRNGISQSFTYTALNDIQTHTDGNGNTTTYNYTSGNLTSIVKTYKWRHNFHFEK